VARRLRWYVQPGTNLDQGQEVGFILFGSRIDFYLPLHAELQVELGQKVRARETVIARLPSKRAF
jgi:phosphatidylserine decarboxylase